MQKSLSLPSSLENSQSESTHWSQEDSSIFQKFKMPTSYLFSAFKLFSTDVSENEDSDNSSEESQTKARGTYRKYTMQEKQAAVFKILHGHDVKEVSKEYGIPRRNLVRWKKNGCQRKQGGGRPTDQEMETILYDKIKSKEINGEREIRAAAILASKSKCFKASKGWFSKFSRRYKSQTGDELIKV